MPVTDEQLQAMRDENDRLRQQIAEAERQRADRDAATTRELYAVQLEAERSRLEAQLAQAQTLADAAGAEGAASLVETVRVSSAPAEYEISSTEDARASMTDQPAEEASTGTE